MSLEVPGAVVSRLLHLSAQGLLVTRIRPRSTPKPVWLALHSNNSNVHQVQHNVHVKCHDVISRVECQPLSGTDISSAPTATCCCTSHNPWHDAWPNEPALTPRGEIWLHCLFFQPQVEKLKKVTRAASWRKSKAKQSSKALPYLKQSQGCPMTRLHRARWLLECSKHDHLDGIKTRFQRKTNKDKHCDNVREINGTTLHYRGCIVQKGRTKRTDILLTGHGLLASMSTTVYRSHRCSL